MTEGDAGTELDDLSELLWRHVHPSWVRDGEPTSQAFKPTPKDQGKLSVSRGSLTTAPKAFAMHTESLGLDAVGTWAVSVGEVVAEPIVLSVYGDPVSAPVSDPAHALIDSSAQSRKSVETKAKLLLAAARRRAIQHPV